MNRQLLLSEFLTTPWALMPERLQAMSVILTRWSAGEPPNDETLFQVNTDRLIRDTRKQMAAASTGTGIAVLPLYGVVTQRGNMVDDISGPGSTSTQQFTSVLRQMLTDDTVGQILIDIDSPGGSVTASEQIYQELLAFRATGRPVVLQPLFVPNRAQGCVGLKRPRPIGVCPSPSSPRACPWKPRGASAGLSTPRASSLKAAPISSTTSSASPMTTPRCGN